MSTLHVSPAGVPLLGKLPASGEVVQVLGLVQFPVVIVVAVSAVAQAGVAVRPNARKADISKSTPRNEDLRDSIFPSGNSG